MLFSFPLQLEEFLFKLKQASENKDRTWEDPQNTRALMHMTTETQHMLNATTSKHCPFPACYALLKQNCLGNLIVMNYDT